MAALIRKCDKLLFKFIKDKHLTLLVSDLHLACSRVTTGLLLTNQQTTGCQGQIRTAYGSALTHLNAEELWKGVTTISNPGRKKGAGKFQRIAKNLNRGQFLGRGKINMVWPGLTGPILLGKDLAKRTELPPNQEYEDKIIEYRKKLSQVKRFKLGPLQKGFAGTRWPGRSLGPPDPTPEGSFEGFDTKVLEHRTRSVMTSLFGRKRQARILVVTGNQNGLAGYAISILADSLKAMGVAKRKASQTLQYFERFEDRTVFHNFKVTVNKTTLLVKKKPKGYGVKCHRVLKVICEMIGFKDIHITVEGSINPNILTQAFFLGLEKQNTHQQLADRMGLNVVEIKEACDNYPRLVAAPANGCRKREEIPEDEVTDYDEIIMDGRMEQPTVQRTPHYAKLPSYAIAQKRDVFRRNHQNVRLNLLAKHNDHKSFYHYKEEKRLQENRLEESTS